MSAEFALKDDSEAVRLLLGRLFQPSPNTLPVIHPSFKALGRIWVPWPVLTHTSGLDRVLQNHPHAPSLCALYQIGKCNSREKCNQIHVDRHWASTIWHALEVAATENCCRHCGDLPSSSHELFQALDGEDVALRIPGVSPFAIPIDHIATTRFWQRFLNEERHGLYFSLDRVCMLHQQNTCKYGVECKNVHLCRRVWSEMVKTLKEIPGLILDDSISAAADAACAPGDMTPPAEMARPCHSLAIVDPTSGAEVPVRGYARGHPAPPPAPLAPAQAAPKRTSHALAIVDPKSGAELEIVKKIMPSTAPCATLADEFDLDLALDAGVRCATAVLEDGVEEAGQPAAIQRVPTIETMSYYNAKDKPLLPGGDHEASSEASRATTLGSSGTPRSPSSSAGSDSALPGGATGGPVAATYSKRRFPKPSSLSAPKAHREGLRGVREDPEAKLWARKIEASRGMFKKVNHGLLGVVLAEGPQPIGFGMGRGCSL